MFAFIAFTGDAGTPAVTPGFLFAFPVKQLQVGGR